MPPSRKKSLNPFENCRSAPRRFEKNDGPSGFFNKDLPPSLRPGERLSLKKRPRNHQAAIPANKIQWAG
ncbi:MAG: hypothetical protein C6W56_04705 [Caldibacillus debilis]|nr:MAG: hypothetical protein C6W56_04705 [Caldibacillus debilis]